MQIMNIHIIEMPLDYGASRHGSDMGPSAIRLAGLRGTLEELGHHIVRTLSPMDGTVQEFEEVGNPKAKYLKPIVAANEKLAVEVEKAASAQEFPLVLGGDHSIVLGTLAGLSAAYKKQDLTMGMLYVDAHGDFNTDETTPSGNIHGECVSASCGYGLPELTNLYFEGQKINPENICYVALRDVDPGEKVLMKKAGVTAFTMSDIDRQGFQSVLKQVTSFFKSRVDVIHISFDMDSIDPMFAPGTGVAVPGGLNYREALLLMEEMAQTNMVRSAEIVEVNPILDVRNQTAKMAVELAARLLGKTLF
jgi:arginase